MIATKMCACGQHLEFEAEYAEQLRCPACERPVLGQITPPPLPEQQRRALERLEKEKKEKRFIIWTVSAVALTLAACWALAQIAPARAGSNNFDAYYTAEQFIKRQYPGAKSISSYRESVVEPDGNIYRVAVTVDGLNAFGGPVRQGMIVEMARDDASKTWRLVEIYKK